MSIEGKIGIQPKTYEENWEVFRGILDNRESELIKMVEDGKAYIKDKKDAKGELASFEIFSVDGTLLYFKDIAGLEQFALKLTGNH